MMESRLILPKLILLVEDNETCAKLFTSILTNGFGVRVHHAEDGKSARTFLAKHRPDAIQMDIQLPDESGWDLIRSFKMDEHWHDIPIYVVTACGLLFKEERLYERSLIVAEMEKPVALPAYVMMVQCMLRSIDAKLGRSTAAVA